MSKKNGKQASLADPSRLKPLDSQDKNLLRVVIETPKGSRNKFAFDPKQHIFELKKVLPAGMTFPYDFGFVPSTEADDGDPIDVLVLMDEPAFPGCVLSCRPIGVIEGEQGDNKKKERNDRIIAVLESLDGAGRGRGRGGPRNMSVASRNRIAAAQRARWAKWRSLQKKK